VKKNNLEEISKILITVSISKYCRLVRRRNEEIELLMVKRKKEDEGGASDGYVIGS
jgi:hypothetical protein